MQGLSWYGPVGMLKPDKDGSPKCFVRDRAEKQEGKDTQELQRQVAALSHAAASSRSSDRTTN